MAKKILNIKIAAVITMIFVLVFATPKIYVFANGNDIVMGVEAGFNNMARYGSYVPFRITVQNKADDIQCEAQVLVSSGYDTRVIHAAPAVLPSGVAKEIIINVPMYTADRNVEVRLVDGKSVLCAVDYSFEKLVSPTTPVLGVLSDDPGVFAELRGIRLIEIMKPNTLSEIQTKYNMPPMEDGYITLDKTAAEVVQLGKNNFPIDDIGMDSFDFIVISSFDTSSLSDKQYKALVDWVKKGNTLALIVGQHAAKVTAGLDNDLSFFDINGSISLKHIYELENFIEQQLPEDIYVTDVRLKSGDAIVEEQGIPIVSAKKLGNGSVVVLSFDPFFEPFATFGDSRLLLENVLSKVASMLISNLPAQRDTYGSIRDNIGNLRYLASQVPETMTPPFRMMLVILGVYILIVGPILYFVLKRMDKRDMSWVAIPILAAVFVSVIYIAGYKTRFAQAVVNNVSVIFVNQVEKTAHIDTAMTVFSDERNRMVIEYPKNSGISVGLANEYYDHIGYRQNSSANPNQGIIRAKYTDSNPVIYEQYDAGLWAPNYFSASTQLPYKGGIFDSFSLKNGVLTVNIKNNTEMTLKDALLCIGNIYTGVGQLMPEETKTLTINLMDHTTNSFDYFINDWLGPYSPQQGGHMTIEMRESIRKRDLINNVFRHMFDNTYEQGGKIKLSFIAFDDSNPGYQLKVNGKAPKAYNTNIVYSEVPIEMSEGSRIEYPTGIIAPVFEDYDNKKIGYYSDGYDRSVRVTESGSYDYLFSVPKEISPDWLFISWPKSLYTNTSAPTYTSPERVIENSAGIKEIKYYIYNFKSMSWEETSSTFTLDKDIESMLSGRYEVRVRVSIDLIGESAGMGMFREPQIAVGGVVR